MTVASLKQMRVRELARIAKQSKIRGWHAMRKDQLINELVRRATAGQSIRGTNADQDSHKETCEEYSTGETKRTLYKNGRQTSKPNRSTDIQLQADNSKTDKRSQKKKRATVQREIAVKRIKDVQAQQSRVKSLVTQPEPSQKGKLRNRAVLMARGPHWLHAFWEITSDSVQRVKAAMETKWHTAVPILRVLEVFGDKGETPSERIVREIQIHGGVKNWFIDMYKPMPCRVEVGYKTRCGEFYKLCRSNRIAAARVCRDDSLDIHWKDIESDSTRIFSLSGGYTNDTDSEEVRKLFEERLRQPLGPPKPNNMTYNEVNTSSEKKGFPMEVDAELVIFGSTEKGSYLSIQGEPIDIASDGSFRIRLEMPNRRQVIPIYGQSASGLEQQIVVLAVERNTRMMEPRPIGETASNEL